MKILIALQLVLIVSCGLDNKQKNQKQKILSIKTINTGIDTDGDGLSDEFEKINSLNPLVANVPNIEICREGNLKLEYTNPINQENVRREYIENNKNCQSEIYTKALKYISTQREDLLGSIINPFNEYQSFNMIDWNSETYLLNKSWIDNWGTNNDFQMNFSYHLNFQAEKGFDNISRIQSSLKGNNQNIYTKQNILISDESNGDKINLSRNINTRSLTKNFHSFLNGYEIENELMSKSDINLAITDLTYQIKGIDKDIHFKDILNELQKKTYKLNIITKDKTLTKYISIKHSISDYLKTLENSNITSSGEIKSLLNLNNFNSGKWYSIGTDSDHLSFTPTAGIAYTLLYISDIDKNDHVKYNKVKSFNLLTTDQNQSMVKEISFSEKNIDHLSIETTKDTFEFNEYRKNGMPKVTVPFYPSIGKYHMIRSIKNSKKISNFTQINDLERILLFLNNQWISLDELEKQNIVKLHRIDDKNNNDLLKLVIKLPIGLKNLKVMINKSKNILTMRTGVYYVKTDRNKYSNDILKISYFKIINLFPHEIFKFDIF